MTDYIGLAMFSLIAIMFLQQYTTHKLINKLMSRNFHEYESAVNLNKKVMAKSNGVSDVAEDLGSLQEFTPHF